MHSLHGINHELALYRNGAAIECNPNQIHPFNAPNRGDTTTILQ